MSKVTSKWRPLVTSCMNANYGTINIDTLTRFGCFIVLHGIACY